METLFKGVIIVAGIAFIALIAIVTANQIQSLGSEDFDLQKIRYINEIDSCVDLKKEYQLIKQYDSVLKHSDLYLKAVEDRAQNMMKGPTYCNLED